MFRKTSGADYIFSRDAIVNLQLSSIGFRILMKCCQSILKQPILLHSGITPSDGLCQDIWLLMQNHFKKALCRFELSMKK